MTNSPDLSNFINKIQGLFRASCEIGCDCSECVLQLEKKKNGFGAKQSIYRSFEGGQCLFLRRSASLAPGFLRLKTNRHVNTDSKQAPLLPWLEERPKTSDTAITTWTMKIRDRHSYDERLAVRQSGSLTFFCLFHAHIPHQPHGRYYQIA